MLRIRTRQVPQVPAPRKEGDAGYSAGYLAGEPFWNAKKNPVSKTGERIFRNFFPRRMGQAHPSHKGGEIG
ncbi:MAG: hypothetical protein CW346_12900 [Bacillaceae bacterium]|nr:hypothetical protein [Bacillaceae bacterium]